MSHIQDCRSAWKFLHGVAPKYLRELCVLVEDVCGRPRLRSASTWCVQLSRVQTSVRQSGFAFHRRTLWNSLPPAMRDCILSRDAFLIEKVFITLSAKCGAVYCNCPRLFVGGFVGKGSNHLQLVKFRPSRAPEKGSTAGRNFLVPPYCSQRAVFASPLSTFSFGRWIAPTETAGTS